MNITEEIFIGILQNLDSKWSTTKGCLYEKKILLECLDIFFDLKNTKDDYFWCEKFITEDVKFHNPLIKYLKNKDYNSCVKYIEENWCY